MEKSLEELLLKDLLGRIPYSLKLKIGDYSDYTLIGVVASDEHPIKLEVTEKDTVYRIEVSVDIVRPYLRPMLSMTEGEIDEFTQFDVYSDGEYVMPNYEAIEWLNSHYFDYRGLIEKGLAIAVTKENNPYKE